MTQVSHPGDDLDKEDDTIERLPKNGRGPRWIYSILPWSIGVGPVGTLVQLYLLLDLHSTLIQYTFVITAASGVGIPAAIIWGYVADRFHERKTIIVLTSVAVTANLVGFLFVTSIAGWASLYLVFAFVSAASATPLNLLIMESQRKSKWALGFARFSMVSSVGTTIGLALSALWADAISLRLLVIPLAILSLSSALLAAIMIQEPKYIFEKEMITMEKKRFFHRLLAIPLIFHRVPTLSDFVSIFRELKSGLTSQVPILYISIFIFNFAGGVFNTSLTPSLLSASISSSNVFLVSFVGMVVQTAAFYFAGPYIEKRSLKTTAVSGLALRGICYGLMGVSVLFFTGLTYLGLILVLWPLAAGIGFAVYYTASSVMVFNTLGPRGQASRLGVYSALVGIASMTGSFVSGITSAYIGYYATFILAGILLACAASLTSILSPERSIAVKVGAS